MLLRRVYHNSCHRSKTEKVRTEQDLRPYQEYGVEHAMRHPAAGLLLGVGLGKTVTTLTVINRLKYEDYQIDKVLIIAPKRVAETVWHTEALNWEHLKHLTFSLILGDERKRKEALKAKADVYVINREMIVWLLAQLGGCFPFDLLVIDELSSFKSNTSARFKSLRVVRPQIKRVIGLTGTPMPNGLLDLWPQLYLLDQGERLGKTIGGYREKYFKPGRRNGHIIYDYNIKSDKNDDVFGPDIEEREIFDKISDICISMKAEDYLDLPKRTDVLVEIPMSAALLKQYEDFEETQVLAYVDSLEGSEITAVNAAALTGKLLQFANGAIYTGEGSGKDREYYEVHNLKIDALGEALEAANGDPMLVTYQFQSDVARIKKHLREFDPYLMSSSHTLRDVERWNRKEIPVMLMHAASGGHGLNLQFGGHLMYHFGRGWSRELWDQVIGRLERPGQLLPIFNWTASLDGSMDEQVTASLTSKGEKQDYMMAAVKALVKKYRA